MSINKIPATNIVTLWKRLSRGKRYWAKPDYPFISMVRNHTEFWNNKGWKISETQRAVRRILK